MAARKKRPTSTGKSDIVGSRAVRRALGILELMMEAGKPLTVAEIIARLGIPKSTAYELVNTLSEAGYLAPQGGDNRLFLGRKLFELGSAYRNQVDLIKDGSRTIEALRDLTGETVQLSVLDGDMMLVLMKEEGSNPIRIVSQVGSRVPVNWAASGRLLVSDLDDRALRNLLAGTVRQSPSGRAKLDVGVLVKEVRNARKQGYATETNETNEHAGCVAAPVFDSSGRCVAAISIVAPAARLTASNRTKLIAAVTDAAARLSHRFGA
jgi:DNA-binding IclR family transcriptional regulator